MGSIGRLLALSLLASTQAQTLRIGALVTDSGKFASIGRETRTVCSLWTDYVQLQGGIGPSKAGVEFVYVDVASSAAVTSVVTEKLCNGTYGNIDFLLAPYSSDLTEAAAIVADRYNKTLVSGGASADTLFECDSALRVPCTSSNRTRRFSRLYSVLSEATRYFEPFVAAVKAKGAKTIAFLEEPGLFPKSACIGARQAARDASLSTVFDQATSPLPWDGTNDTAKTAELRAIVQKFKTNVPDVLVGCVYQTTCVQLVQLMRQERLDVKALGLTTCGGNPAFVSNLSTDAAYVSSPAQWHPLLRGPSYRDQLTSPAHLYLDSDAASSSAQFVAAFKQRQGNNVDPSYQAAGVMAALYLIQTGVEQATRFDGDVNRALNYVAEPSFFGLLDIDRFGLNRAKPSVLGQYNQTASSFDLIVPQTNARRDLLYPTPSWRRRITNRNSIKVGVLLTATGRYASVANETRVVGAMLENYINLSTGIGGSGYYIDFVYVDVGSTSETNTRQVTKSLISGAYTDGEPVQFLLAPYSSALTAAAAIEAEAAGAVIVSGGAADENVFACDSRLQEPCTTAGTRRFKYLTGLLTPAKYYMKPFVVYAATQGAKRIAFLTEDSGFTNSVCGGALDTAALNSMSIVMNDTVPQFEFSANTSARDEATIRAKVKQLASLKPDVIVACVYQITCLRLIRFAKDEGLNPSAFALTTCIQTPELLTSLGSDASYVMGPSQWINSLTGLSSSDHEVSRVQMFLKRDDDASQLPSAQQFNNAFQAKAGYAPSYQGAAALGALYALYNGIAAANSVDPVAVQQSLNSLFAASFFGLLSADQNGVNRQKPILTVQYDYKGRVQIVTPSTTMTRTPAWPMPAWKDRATYAAQQAALDAGNSTKAPTPYTPTRAQCGTTFSDGEIAGVFFGLVLGIPVLFGSGYFLYKWGYKKGKFSASIAAIENNDELHLSDPPKLRV